MFGVPNTKYLAFGTPDENALIKKKKKKGWYWWANKYLIVGFICLIRLLKIFTL